LRRPSHRAPASCRSPFSGRFRSARRSGSGCRVGGRDHASGSGVGSQDRDQGSWVRIRRQGQEAGGRIQDSGGRIQEAGSGFRRQGQEAGGRTRDSGRDSGRGIRDAGFGCADFLETVRTDPATTRR
jgi:hypothetical protein